MAKKQVKVEIVGDNQQFNQSMDQATRRVRDFGNQANRSAGNVDKFGQSALSSVASLAKLAVGMGAAAAVAGTMKDAFFKNETLLDEWGRTVEASKTTYGAFLSALNSGDIGGFLSRIDEIIKAAKDAYNALDDLATNNAFMQRATAQYQSEYDKALEAYKLDPTGENKQKVIDANQKIVDELTRKATESEAAYQAELKRLAKERGLSGSNESAFIDLFSNGSAAQLKAMKNGYSTGSGLASGAQYWQGNQVQGDELLIRNAGGVVEARRKMTEEEKKQFEMARVLSQINDTEIEQVQKLGTEYFTLSSAIANQNRSMERLTGQAKGAGGSGSTGEKFDLSAAMNEAALANAMTNVPQMIQEAIDSYGEPLITPEALMDPDVIIDEFGNVWAAVNEQTEDWLEGSISGMDLLHKKAKLMNAEVSKMAGGWAGMGATFQAVGGMMDDSTGKALTGIGNVMSAVAQLIPKLLGEAVVTATGTVARTATTWYEIIPGIAAVTAAIYSAVAGFEEGGVVGGNSTTGDRLLIRANSGERVLTAEQNEWFETLANGGGQESVTSGGVEFRIKNNTLAGTLRNHERRTRYRYA